MIRAIRYTIMILIGILEIITLSYSVGFFVPFSNTIRALLKRSSIIVFVLALVILAVCFVCRKLVPEIPFAIFNEKEYKIFDTITLSLFLLFAGCFIIKARMINWERGSDVYIRETLPAVIPFCSGIIAEIAYWISRQ